MRWRLHYCTLNCPDLAPWCSQQYGCNVLNLGSSRIISCNPSSARQIVQVGQSSAYIPGRFLPVKAQHLLHSDILYLLSPGVLVVQGDQRTVLCAHLICCLLLSTKGEYCRTCAWWLSG